jgi:hypothetical protein
MARRLSGYPRFFVFLFCFFRLSSSYAALCLSSSCATFVGFSFWYGVLLIQIDRSTSIITDLMKTWTSTLQIREYDYSGYFYLVIFVGTFMMSLYAINLGAARLFVDSPFSVFSNLEFVMIYVFSI